MMVDVVEGDLLGQETEVIVNTWNRNIVPWWLLIPQGVSGAIKKRAGTAPFREVNKHGAMALGSAVLTSAGSLPFRGIIHVAGINLFWRATSDSIRKSVRSALELCREHRFESVAFPIIGSGSGGFREQDSLEIMLSEIEKHSSHLRVVVVQYVAGLSES